MHVKNGGGRTNEQTESWILAVGFAKPFHIHCNWLIIKSFLNFRIVGCLTNISTFISTYLVIWSFVNFQMRRCSPDLSTFIAINLSSNYLWIFKLCGVRQIFPHWLQLTYHRVIYEFSNCAFFAKCFHINCTWLIIESFVNFQIVRYLHKISTFIAINLSFDHFWIFKLCVVR